MGFNFKGGNYVSPNSNLLTIREMVDLYIETYRKKYPEDIDVYWPMDLYDSIRDAIINLKNERLDDERFDSKLN